MNIVKFISVQYLKDNTAIQNNVDDDLIAPYILKSQDTHIQQILGTNYYDHLKTAISGSTLTASEEALLRTYVQPALSEWAFYEVLPHLNYKSTNKAVSQQSSEFGTPSILEDVKYLRNSVRDMAEFYSKRLTNELCQNLGNYPLYSSQGTNNLQQKSSKYFGGLYLSRSGPSGIKVYDDPAEGEYDY